MSTHHAYNLSMKQVLWGVEDYQTVRHSHILLLLRIRGLRPVEITGISLDYGAESDDQKRMKYSVSGEMYLAAVQKHEIQKAVSWSEIDKMKQRFGIDQALFFLRVSYQVPNANREESIRQLGGFDGTTTVFLAHRGDRLT